MRRTDLALVLALGLVGADALRIVDTAVLRSS
jgi:hypothetical protein